MPLGDEVMDAGSQLLIALTTENEQEARGMETDGLLYQDFLVMLRSIWGGALRQNHPDHPDPPGAPSRWRSFLARHEWGCWAPMRVNFLTISRRPLPQNWVITPACSLQHHNKGKPTCYIQVC